MIEGDADQSFEQVVARLDPRSSLLRAWPLTGGISAQMTALETATPDGQTRRMIVRRPADASRSPHIAADEFRLLQSLQSAGLPVPTPYHLDQSGEIFPTPYLILEYVEGVPEFAPPDLADFLPRLASILAQIHRVAGPHLDLSFLPGQQALIAEKLRQRPATAESPEAGRIRQALAAAWPLPQLNEPVLLHGDFWLGNLLWRDGRLAAIIDWEDAALGDPLADLANSRLEVLWAFGVDAMQRFTRHYRSLMAAVDFAHLPYWELCAAWERVDQIAGWGLAGHTVREMQGRLEWFVAQAFRALPAP